MAIHDQENGIFIYPLSRAARLICPGMGQVLRRQPMPWTLDEISDLIGNRRYCFVIMAYGGGGAFFREMASLLQNQCNLRCIRADDVPYAGELLMDKVHQLIENAELVIADLSESRPNLYYEVGYAKARGKRVIVICHRGTDFAVDLRGIETIQYEDTKEGLPLFHIELKRQVIALLESDRRLLRSLLIAERNLPSYLLASPRWHTRQTLSETTQERRTYGDYLGVVGIISAFGGLLGQKGVPELISARYANKSLLEQDCNLYLIGSPRANDLTADALTLVQGSRSHPWRFDVPHRGAGNRTLLIGFREGKEWVYEADHSVSLPQHDYGLFIRGPHPKHKGRLIMVFAGGRSLGTGGVCLAATRPRLIQQIRDKLGPVPLDDQQKILWALVCAKPDPTDNHASVEYTEVVDTGML